MEPVCDLCQAHESIEIGLVADLYLYTPGAHRLRRCRRCGLVWCEPAAQVCETSQDYAPHRPAAAPPSWRTRFKRAALAGRGYPAGDCSWLERRLGAWLGLLWAGRLAQVPDYLPGGRLLDLGCGAGAYVAAMRALGWGAIGLEPSAGVLPTGCAAYIVGRAEDPPLAAATFDVVTGWHALEHAESPARALAAARRLLRPGGRLLLETPNIASLQARLFGRYWLHLDPPRHRYHFTPATLRAYLERAGFTEIKIWSIPSAVGWAGSLGARLNVASGRRGRALLESRLAQALCWPAAAIEAALGRGGCLRARARRPDLPD